MQNYNKSFTLIECIIAVSVLSLAVFSLVEVLGLGLHLEKESAQASQALMWAQAGMEQVMTTSYSEIASQEKQDIEAGGAFSQEILVSQKETELKEVEVRVCWNEGKKCRSLKNVISKK